MCLRGWETPVWTIFCMFERRYKSLPSINLPYADYRLSTSSAKRYRLYREFLCRRPKSIFSSHIEVLCLLPQYCHLYIHTGHNIDATGLSKWVTLPVCLSIMYINKTIEIQTIIYSVFIKYKTGGDTFATDCIIINLLVADPERWANRVVNTLCIQTNKIHKILWLDFIFY